jgi:hypothetical protein
MFPYTLHGTQLVTLRLVNSRTILLSKRTKKTDYTGLNGLNGLHDQHG